MSFELTSVSFETEPQLAVSYDVNSSFTIVFLFPYKLLFLVLLLLSVFIFIYTWFISNLIVHHDLGYCVKSTE